MHLSHSRWLRRTFLAGEHHAHHRGASRSPFARHSSSQNVRWACRVPTAGPTYSGWPTPLGVRRVSLGFILMGFAAFVLVNVVYYEFVQPKLGDLRRKIWEWMYFEE